MKSALRVKVFLVLCLIIMGSCTEKYIGDPKELLSNRTFFADTVHNLKHLLVKEKDFQIFQAILRQTHLDSVLSSTGNYHTLLAPTDSTFAANGITLASLPTYATDSLTHLIQYHLAFGNFRDSLLLVSPGYLLAPSLRLYSVLSVNRPVASNTVENFLYLDKTPNGLWINGKKVNSFVTDIEASNGTLQPIKTLLKVPDSSVYQIIKSRRRFSCFFSALQVAKDYNGNVGNDTALLYTSNFGTPYINLFTGYISLLNSPVNSNNFGATIFAPTNLAFHNAGFDTLHIAKSLMNFQKRYYFAGSINFIVEPLDSILFTHFLIGQSLFYNDFLQNHYLNKRGYADNGFKASPGTYYNQTNLYGSLNQSPYAHSDLGLLSYYNNGADQVQIKWTALEPKPSANIVGRDIVAYDGIIQAVDQLFSPNH